MGVVVTRKDESGNFLPTMGIFLFIIEFFIWF